MIRRVLAVLAASIVVSGTTATAALADYPPTVTGGFVSSTSVVLNGIVVFSGDGFRLNSAVDIEVNHALFATVRATEVTTSGLDSSSAVHFANAAYARTAAATTGSASFSIKVKLETAGANVLTATGVDPSGKPRVVTAKVTVAKATGTPTATSSSSLPFTGSSVIVPGAIVGLAMLGGGFLLLTTVRSRRAGQARS